MGLIGLSSKSDAIWKRLDILLVAITIIVLSGSIWVWTLAMPIAREIVYFAATIALVISLVLVVNVAVLVLFRLQQRVSHLENLVSQRDSTTSEPPAQPEVIVVTLTPIERRVINRLEENGGTLTQDELRRTSGLSKSTLSVTLKGLERKFLVSRKEAGRTKIVRLERKVPR